MERQGLNFELMGAPQSGPVKRIAAFADPRAACVAAWRRCRMYSLGHIASLDAHYASVDYVRGDSRVTLIEFRRVLGEQGTGKHRKMTTLGVSVTPTPELDPTKFFVLSRPSDGVLMIEGPQPEEPPQ